MENKNKTKQRAASQMVPQAPLELVAETVGKKERTLERVGGEQNGNILCASKWPPLWPMCHYYSFLFSPFLGRRG